MNAPGLQRSILELATEDFVGLWETLPVAREICQCLAERELRARVSMALLHLMQEGLVEFFAGAHFSGEQAPLSPEAVERELSDPRNWDAQLPPTERHLRFVATELGRDRYFGRRKVV